MVNKDPNGVAAAVAVIVMAIAGAFNLGVDDETAGGIGAGVAALISVASIIWARTKAWAPDTVAALDPTTVGDAGELPEVPK